MKIDLISQGRENVLFLPSNMAVHPSNAYYKKHFNGKVLAHGKKLFMQFTEERTNHSEL